ncbi:MAG: helix-turn-helix domain-containing protein [Tepidisphaeraceae bacterium]|jgi:excisionase family DNA binding protein
MPKGLDIIGTHQAAKILGLTPDGVIKLITKGKLPADKLGRDYIIRRTDLALVKERKMGRPPGRKTK